MPEIYKCEYCGKSLSVNSAPYHEPACKMAAQMTALREVIHEALKTRVELKPEGEVRAAKCEHCGQDSQDLQALAIHEPLCVIAIKLTRIDGVLEEGIPRIFDSMERRKKGG